MNLIEEADEIIEHAQADYRNGDITAEKFRVAEPVKMYQDGEVVIYVPRMNEEASTALVREAGRKLTVTAHDYYSAGGELVVYVEVIK
jgi:hypothetical protein